MYIYNIYTALKMEIYTKAMGTLTWIMHLLNILLFLF